MARLGRSQPFKPLVLPFNVSRLLTAQLDLYYKLDGNSNDSVGTSDGTDTGITYSTGNGKINQGAGFNGTTSKIALAYSFIKRDFSVGYWINTTATAADTFSYRRSGAQSNPIVKVGLSGGKAFFQIRSDAGAIVTITGATSINNGAWHYVVATFNNTSNAMNLYVDGSSDVAPGTYGGGAFTVDTGFIGTDLYDAGLLTGAIDEFAIWRRVLKASDVTSLWNSGSGLQYPFTSAPSTVTTQTETGVARVEITTTKTETGKARITATTTKTETGVARITITTTQTETGVARVTATTTKTETGIANINNNTIKTETGIARITATTTKTETGVSRITATTTKTETGVGRITATTTKTETGTARITATTTKTETGVSRITATTTKTLTGVAKILAVTQQTETGVARITATTTKTETGTARITATTTKTETGVARIQITTTKTETGVSRVTATTTKTETGVAKITATTTKTETGTARITATTTKTETGVSRITATTTKTETGVARITATTTKTETGTARITATTTKTETGVARVQITTTKTETGVARITATTTKTETGTARITATTTKTETGTARITTTVTKTESGVARITATTTKTETGISRITATTTKTETGVSRITATTTQTLTGVANIVTSTLQTGLQVYYKLDGNSTDSSGNGYNGTDTAISYSTGNGKINQGAGLNGTTSQITTPFNPTLGNLTLSAWVKTTATSGDIVSWRKGSGLSNAILRFGISGSVAYFQLRGTAGTGSGAIATATSAATVNDGVFHLVTVTLNGSTGAMIVYIDGSASGSGATYGLGALAVDTGAISNDLYDGDFLNAAVDEVGMWSRTLSSLEVSQLYNGGNGLQYPFTTVTTTKTETGVARITATTTKTESGVARITATTTRTETGVAKIVASSRLKYWNGSSWVVKPIKYWSGSSFIQKPIKYWNGSTWQ